MGKIKTHIQDWLDNGGYDLGYGNKSSPELKDFKVIKDNRIPVWEYYGYATEEEYWEARFGEPDEPDDFEPVEY